MHDSIEPCVSISIQSDVVLAQKAGWIDMLT